MTIDEIRAEQIRCAAYLKDHPHDRGARLGLADWVMEEIMTVDYDVGTSYESFLERKRQYGSDHGFKPYWMPSFLFDFQAYLTDWSLHKGRSAAFADCGMGKTLVELVWAENVVRHTNKPVLINTALAVAVQMMEEAEKFGIDCVRSRDGSFPAGARIVITNYEMLHRFEPSKFAGVVCDESGILKNFNGKRKGIITEFMRTIPYRLMGTATPAPNNHVELGTHSEALGELGYMDMLGRFFKNDQNTCDTKMLQRRAPSHGGPITTGWRFKGHAEQHFYRWVCSWARAGRKPSDFGPFDDSKFDLPLLILREHIVETRNLANGMLFPLPATNAREEREERRRTIEERCEKAAELVYGTKRPAIIWCHLNDEGDMLERIIPECRQIKGATSDEAREEIYTAFSNGQLRVLPIKARIGAWGMNWQHCNHIVTFASHSYEQHYQGIRRCWRFGQKNPVTVDLIATEGEQGAKENMLRKSEAADRMFTQLAAHMNAAIKIERDQQYKMKPEVPSWL